MFTDEFAKGLIERSRMRPDSERIGEPITDQDIINAREMMKEYIYSIDPILWI